MRFVNAPLRVVVTMPQYCLAFSLACTSLIIGVFFSTPLQADEVRIAVASNFSHAIKALSKTFEAQAQHKIILSYGATGRHYSQIINGAPFDIFLAADAKRPELLEKKGVIIPGSRFTYAIGKLALWSSADNFVDQQAAVLTSKRFKHLAIANPKLAPYGKAGKQFLKQQGLWKSLTSKMIRTENIAQSFQFVKSGNVELGFVALSHVKQLGENEKGSLWIVPTDTYTPIKQQAVLLKDKPAAKMFLNFMKSPRAQAIIAQYGYDQITTLAYQTDKR